MSEQVDSRAMNRQRIWGKCLRDASPVASATWRDGWPWMADDADVFERKTGVRLHPGSLNVVLDELWVVERAPIRLEPPEYGASMSIVPCEIEGVSHRRAIPRAVARLPRAGLPREDIEEHEGGGGEVRLATCRDRLIPEVLAAKNQSFEPRDHARTLS